MATQAETSDNRDCGYRNAVSYGLMAVAPSLRPEAADIFRRLDAAGRTQRELADALGIEQNKVSKVRSGERQFKAGEVLAAHAWLSGSEALAPIADQPAVRTADAGDTAPVMRLDLSYSMGPGTDIDDSYIEGEAFEFDVGFLRGMTVTPPERIRIVDGIGDSMTPTLHDRDLLFIDVNQRDLNAQDRIWAIWLFGLGAVKRLRAVGPDRVLVISDNPEIDNQEVSKDDILIHGRVIGSIKRH